MTTNVSSVSCQHSHGEHLFHEPLCDKQTLTMKVANVAFHIFTLGIVYAVYHLIQCFMTKKNDPSIDDQDSSIGRKAKDTLPSISKTNSTTSKAVVNINELSAAQIKELVSSPKIETLSKEQVNDLLEFTKNFLNLYPGDKGIVVHLGRLTDSQVQGINLTKFRALFFWIFTPLQLRPQILTTLSGDLLVSLNPEIIRLTCYWNHFTEKQKRRLLDEKKEDSTSKVFPRTSTSSPLKSAEIDFNKVEDLDIKQLSKQQLIDIDIKRLLPEQLIVLSDRSLIVMLSKEQVDDYVDKVASLFRSMSKFSLYNTKTSEILSGLSHLTSQQVMEIESSKINRDNFALIFKNRKNLAFQKLGKEIYQYVPYYFSPNDWRSLTPEQVQNLDYSKVDEQVFLYIFSDNDRDGGLTVNHVLLQSLKEKALTLTQFFRDQHWQALSAEQADAARKALIVKSEQSEK